MSTVTRRPNVPAENQPTIATFINRLTPEISRALPRHMDGDRMARLALTVVRKTPKLAECSPESFAGALLTCAALGLEPGVNGEAHLVPYKRECQLIIGYQGYAKLFYQHPLAANIDAQAVYEADEFDYAYGTDPFLRHKPALRGDRGDVVAYYASARLTTGASAFVVLSPEEVKALRRGKVGSTDIPDPQRWMERKTALRQLVKLLPRATTLAEAVAADERTGTALRESLTRQIEPVRPVEPEHVRTDEGYVVDPDTGELLDGGVQDEWPATTEPGGDQ